LTALAASAADEPGSVEPDQPAAPEPPPPQQEQAPRRPGGLPRVVVVAPVVGLLLLHFLIAVASVRTKSPTYDEPFHLTCGYTYWQTGDFRMAAGHPPLATLWAALPLAAAPVKFPSFDSVAWRQSDLITYSYSLFFRQGNDLDKMLLRSRAMVALLSVGLGLVVFLWSRSLFGLWGGLISLTVYCFSPSILASARLVTTDMAVTAFFLCAVGGAWWALNRLTPLSAACSALAFAGLFLSKLTAFFSLPMLLALVVIRVATPRPLPVKLGRREFAVRTRLGRAGACAALLVVYFVVVYTCLWTCYGFRYATFRHNVKGGEMMFMNSLERQQVAELRKSGGDEWSYFASGQPAVKAVIEFCRRHKLFPEIWLYSILRTSKRSQKRVAFLNGRYSLTGFPGFFLYCFLYKTPLPLMALLLCAAAATCLPACGEPEGAGPPPPPALERRLGAGLYRTAPLWLLLAVYWTVVLRSHIHIGLRHILPTYPPMFILAGASAALLKRPSRSARCVPPVLVALLVAGSLSVHPHYLAYFNRIAGGPANGHRHLVDSCLDWGQDLVNLKNWLEENAKGEKAFVTYFGSTPPSFYKVPATPFPFDASDRRPLTLNNAGRYKPTAGVYCISATVLQQVYPPGLFGGWTEKREQRYWQALAEMRGVEDMDATLFAFSPDLRLKWTTSKGRLRAFQQLRFGKLCHGLLQREPDAMVGYSILVYRLSDADIRDLLYVRKR